MLNNFTSAELARMLDRTCDPFDMGSKRISATQKGYGSQRRPYNTLHATGLDVTLGPFESAWGAPTRGHPVMHAACSSIYFFGATHPVEAARHVDIIYPRSVRALLQ